MSHAPTATPPPVDFSLNQRTLHGCPLPELLPLLGDRGVRWVGLWLEPVWELGTRHVVRLLERHGLRVSSVCRAVSLTSGDPAARERNLRAVATTAELGAACLAVVPGGLPSGSRDLGSARRRVHEELALLGERAAEHGVRLALEPMHPVFAADRGVISSLRQAVDLVEDLPADAVGLAVDSFHVWWEPDLEETWARAAGRVVTVQIGDWETPVTVGRDDGVLQRGVPGDGHLDLAAFVATAHRLGWEGPVEVELFNDRLAARDPREALDLLVDRCAPLLEPA